MGVYVHHLAGGETVTLEADRPFQMASVFKVPLLAELTSQAAAGVRSLEEPFTLTDAMKAPGSGVLKELSAGTRFSVRDLATLMIIVSDNTATDILLGLIGTDAVNARLRACGLEHTVVTMAAARCSTISSGSGMRRTRRTPGGSRRSASSAASSITTRACTMTNAPT